MVVVVVVVVDERVLHSCILCEGKHTVCAGVEGMRA